MQRALDAFHASIARVEHLGGLHKALEGLTTPIVDASDLLRAQVVLAVSALDYYIHELTVLGMIEVLEGNRPSTKAFQQYRVSIGAVSSGLSTGSSAWFAAEVRDRHSFLAFQQPDKVADAIRLFSGAKLWQAVSRMLGETESNVKDRLRLIVDRRNKIAHEADLDPSYPGTRWPISAKDVAAITDFLRRVAEAVHATVV